MRRIGGRAQRLQDGLPDRRISPYLSTLDWRTLLNGTEHIVQLPGIDATKEAAAVRAKAYREAALLNLTMSTRRVTPTQLSIQAMNPWPPGSYMWNLVRQYLWALPADQGGSLGMPTPVDVAVDEEHMDPFEGMSDEVKEARARVAAQLAAVKYDEDDDGQDPHPDDEPQLQAAVAEPVS